MLRAAIRPDARVLLAERRFVVLAAEATDGHVWVSLVTGPAGFVTSSEDGTRLHVANAPDRDDPIAAALAPESSVGLLGIDFQARRRYRVNGTVQPVSSGISLDVREAFGNCPKYIHAYTPLPDGSVSGSSPRTADRLDERQKLWIEQAE